jgi:hypothetical protein
MQMAAQDGKLHLKLGRTFAARDTERVVEILESLAPFSEVVVDCTNVHSFHDAAFPRLFEVMERFTGVRVTFRGLTDHHLRLLRYLGLPVGESSMCA